jgi:glycosyltransferase involved in cell wall biosynthesis
VTKSSYPLVTVYMPTHNRCQLLKRAVESVFKQSYPAIELIIVDDASTDDTHEYLTELVTKHNNIQFFTQQSAKGACAARNIAIKVAQGEFVTGLDDDDEFLPERIENLVVSYDEKYAFTCTGFLWHYGKKSRAVDNTAKIITLDEQLNYNYATNQVLVETVRLRAIDGFDENFVACQDYDTWTRLIKKYGNAKRVAGASYIIHRGDDVVRLTEPTNWLNGHRQYVEKHGGDMSATNKINQEFRRIIAKRQRLTLLALCQQLMAGLAKQKLRYFFSSNFSFLGNIRRYFLEK